MNAYVVRAKPGMTDKPYFGLFAARDIIELFWAVDEFANPMAFQYARLKLGGGVLLAANQESCINDDIEGAEDCEFFYDDIGGHVINAVASTQTQWIDFNEADQ